MMYYANNKDKEGPCMKVKTEDCCSAKHNDPMDLLKNEEELKAQRIYDQLQERRKRNREKIM